MDKGIYTALSGGIAKGHELELVANNLANANTPGFKRDTATFNEYLTEFRRVDSAEGLKREISAAALDESRPNGDKSFVELDAIYTDFQQGPLQRTNRSLDVALEGDGFLEVLTPAGIRYTRQGNLSISAEGRLVTMNGYPVLANTRDLPRMNEAVEVGPDGQILSRQSKADPSLPFKELPPEERFIDLAEGSVRIAEDGRLYQNGEYVSTLSVAEFHEPQWLEKVGNSYFQNTDPRNGLVGRTRTQVHQGFLEGANVNAVREMTKLIEVTRSYESHMQAIKTYQEIDSRTANEIAKLG